MLFSVEIICGELSRGGLERSKPCLCFFFFSPLTCNSARRSASHLACILQLGQSSLKMKMIGKAEQAQMAIPPVAPSFAPHTK